MSQISAAVASPASHVAHDKSKVRRSLSMTLHSVIDQVSNFYTMQVAEPPRRSHRPMSRSPRTYRGHN